MILCPGSDVNSMDSVDSGCTMGAGEGQTNHAASSSAELVVWEIEVPKVSLHKGHFSPFGVVTLNQLLISSFGEASMPRSKGECMPFGLSSDSS